jgi:hypothetical protein
MSGNTTGQSEPYTKEDLLVMTLTEHGLLVNDLLWAMEWLNSHTDDLNTAWRQINDEAEEHPRSREFLDELAERRKVKITLNSVAREVGL